MQEIKFRGKRVDNGEWVCGGLINNLWKKSGSGEFIPYIFTTQNCDECEYTEQCCTDEEFFTCEKAFSEVIPETVGQYTGLKDKNGKEIYEGDIIRFAIFDYNSADTQYKGVVKWANAMFEIWHDAESEYYGSDGGFVLSWVKAQDDEFEVIGNIYENSELLNV